MINKKTKKNPQELCLSRFVAGLGTGVTFAVAPMYLGEIAPPKIRGILLTLIMVFSRFGIMYAYTLIPFVTLKTSSLISLTLSILYILYCLWLPESPYYLIRRGNNNLAAKSLARLRGKNLDEINDELIIIETSVKNERANNTGGLKDIFLTPGNRRCLTIGVMLGLFQQLSGSQAIMMYTQQLFDDINVDLDGKYLAMILGVVQIFSTGLCVIIVDRYGRRPLLLLSSIGSFSATGVIALYFNLRWIGIDTSSVSWLPALGCMLYVVFYSLGLAPLPTAMIGELFPTNVKALGCAITVFSANFGGFTVGKTYQIIADTVGVHICFWTFTVLNAFAIIYIYFCIPETKGKTLQEIQKELQSNSK